jgi:deoxyhypusine synthase
MSHFKYRGDMDDKTLYELGYDRVYDTLELEKNLLHASLVIEEIFMREDLNDKTYTSPEICRMVGRHLVENNIGGASILKTAFKADVPVYIPALNDSELGLSMLTLRHGSIAKKKRSPVAIHHNAFGDVEDFADRIEKQEMIGLFTIGGGVPRNWAQQVAPYIELRNEVLRRTDSEFPLYSYGVRICPEPVHWGGLSGCTYSEGMSWGKFRTDGKFAEVFADATVVLPFLIKALMERFDGR